ncbi:VWA domain-containing protein [Halobacterium zhouii]|uniref:VWA domain-containing protein n=1 Tax=Halobacterium zhouii TaxID=2902624 RepID=UPI001E40A9BB|nr:VWA domain-containing protein [Halobacterium zhouii]
MSDVPDFEVARDHVRDELVRFTRALRRAGVGVPANAQTTAARALVEVGFDDESRANVALRACLVTEREDLDTFDRLFGEFWRRLTAGVTPEGSAERREDDPDGGFAPLGGAPADERVEESSGRETDGDSDDQRGAAASSSLGGVVSKNAGEHVGEHVATKRSPTGTPTPVAAATTTPDQEFERAFADLTDALAGLRGRRWTAGGDERADARRALRSSFGTGGIVVSMPQRERTRPAVRALLLVDVSQSVLDTVDRSFLLGFLRRARADWRDASVYFFDEELRDVSNAFDAPSQTAALDALERAEAEWGGGTRIGASLAQLPPDAVDHRTDVFVVSDGLETGDVAELERALSGIAQRAASVRWLNPLAASPAYEPAARGMAAAQPFVDGIFAFSEAADLTELARQLRTRGPRERVGYEYDSRRE